MCESVCEHSGTWCSRNWGEWRWNEKWDEVAWNAENRKRQRGEWEETAGSRVCGLWEISSARRLCGFVFFCLCLLILYIHGNSAKLRKDSWVAWRMERWSYRGKGDDRKLKWQMALALFCSVWNWRTVEPDELLKVRFIECRLAACCKDRQIIQHSV